MSDFVKFLAFITFNIEIMCRSKVCSFVSCGFCTPFFIEEVPVYLMDATRPVSKHSRYAFLRATLFCFVFFFHFGVHYI